MKKKCIFIFTCIIAFSLIGCTAFKRPTGKWKCEEIDIIIDFDSGKPATGQIKTDGKLKDIVCILSVSGGGADICYADTDYENINYSDIDFLYSGYFKYQGKDKMILIITKLSEKHAEETGEEYTFIRDTSE